MAELWIIRHFRTPWNSEGRLQGQRDITLDAPLGEADMATLAANRVALAGQSFALTLTSPLGRARETAALHGHSGAEPDPDLAELHFGPWEGRSWNELEAAHPGLWATAPQKLVLGEDFAVFAQRIERILTRAQTAGGPVLAFGHGAWMSALQSLLAGEGGYSLSQFPVGNGALLRVPL